VAVSPDRQSVVVAAGGSVYQVGVRQPGAVVSQTDLGGEVGRSLGLAVTGTPGKVIYLFETGGEKSGRAALAATPGGDKVTVYRWPDAAGEPVGAGWANDHLAVVGTARGSAVWFDFDEGNFLPLAVARVPGDRAVHATGPGSHWYLVEDGGKSVLLELGMPPDGFIDYRNQAEARRPVFTLRLDAKGLHK
jgi:hypothetical protein